MSKRLALIIGNSLSTMLAKPKARVPITMAGATIGIVLPWLPSVRIIRDAA